MESKAGTNEKDVQTAYHYLKYNNNKHNIVVYHKIWKKYKEIQLTKKQTVLGHSKNEKLSTLHRKQCNNN